MKRTGKLAWMTLLLLVALGSGAGYLHLSSDQREEEVTKANDEVRIRAYQESVAHLAETAAKSTSKEDWVVVRTRAEALPKEFEKAKGYFTRLAQVRIIELDARRRDQLLANAGELLSANENDPEAKRRLADAKVLHGEIESALKKVASDKGNPEWNKALEYRRAYEAYRSLAFLEKGEHTKALDIIAGAVSNLGKALLSFPKDNRTERAIEFLYKRAQEEEAKAQKARGSSGDDPAPARPRGLPGPTGPGNGGDDRPRLH